jgi:two-component system sensor histidine kinase KdpD
MRGGDQDRFGGRDAEAVLRQVEAAERATTRGSLTIFLGYAAGVGKSFRMFDEARRRQSRGEDVIVAATQQQMDPEVADVVRELPSVAGLTFDSVPVIDVPAVLARHPEVCLVDGLAYDNPPGCRHPKRCQDVEELLDAGISVMTSLNLEYIEEQQAFVKEVTGRTSPDMVPQAFVNRADEVVVVDAPPAADTREEGEQMSRLRQRALLLTADVVDRQLGAYLQVHGIEATWGTQERILVCMTPRANAATMLASGRRNADRFHGELFAVYVNQPNLTAEDRLANDRNALLARAQQAQIAILDSKDPIKAILDYARSHGITQLFVGHNLRRTLRTRFTGSPLDRLIHESEGMDVRVFPH